jgi:hypothetical protein
MHRSYYGQDVGREIIPDPLLKKNTAFPPFISI